MCHWMIDGKFWFLANVKKKNVFPILILRFEVHIIRTIYNNATDNNEEKKKLHKQIVW